jgi:hypothetical protein
MPIVATYTSPDGALRFRVTKEHGDITLGFENFLWHTHGDLLAWWYACPEEAAVKRFIEDLVQSRTMIAIARRDGRIVDIRVTDDPQAGLRWKPYGETLEFRYWNGTAAHVG